MPILSAFIPMKSSVVTSTNFGNTKYLTTYSSKHAAENAFS